MKILTVVVALIGSLLGCFTRKGAAAAEAKPPRNVPVERFLFDAGDRCDCYFTIERWDERRDRRRGPSPFDTDLNDAEHLTEIEPLIEKLRGELKGVAIVRNQRNPKVIHLIEESLLKPEDYPVEQKTSVNYSGAIANLPEALGRSIPGIEATAGRNYPGAIILNLGGIPSDVFNDDLTQVKVAVENETVRNILTHCAPLQGYRRILWRATTFAEGGGFKTAVQYYGPKPEVELWYVKAVITYPPDRPESERRTVTVSDKDQLRDLLEFFPGVDEGKNSSIERGDWRPFARIRFCNENDQCATVLIDAALTRWSESRGQGEWPLKPEFKKFFERLRR